VDGQTRLTYQPREYVPILEWLKLQGRFRHLLAPEAAADVQAIQQRIDDDWDELLRRCAA
jgi:pyruvate ferredoxin oxidoreductase beta subunit